MRASSFRLLGALSLCVFATPLSFAYPSRGGCRPPAQFANDLPWSPGYVQYIEESKLAPFKAVLPTLADTRINAVLHAADTIWYDDESMIFSYQDSIESVVGLRANCVGRDVGETNSNPAIKKLMNYFGPDYKFLYPFRTVAGTDNVQNIKTLNFWAPPKNNGTRLPVKYWRPTSRGRWRWTFPSGTLFGEVLFQKNPSGQWVVFEVRTRERYLEGWAPDVFRPFCQATKLAEAIEKRQPDYGLSISLSEYVRHLKNPQTLVPHHLESKAYGKVFPPIDGSLDKLPGVDQNFLITALLTETPFTSCEGSIWKENGRGLETYAPGSQSDFNVVPKGYELGAIAINELSCARCHSETGRRLRDFEFDIQLYGEVWGEDRIFTWHLFKPNNQIFGTFDDSDGSRIVNPRLVSARLVENSQPAPGDPFYKVLTSAFDDEKPAPPKTK